MMMDTTELYEEDIKELHSKIEEAMINIHKMKGEQQFLELTLDVLKTEEGKELYRADREITTLLNIKLAPGITQKRPLKSIYNPNTDISSAAYSTNYGYKWDESRLNTLKKRFEKHKGEFCRIGSTTVKLTNLYASDIRKTGYSEVRVQGLSLRRQKLDVLGGRPMPIVIRNNALPLGTTIDCIDREVADVLLRKL